MDKKVVKKIVDVVIAIVIGVVFSLLRFGDLTPEAMKFIGIFIATMYLMIRRAFPDHITILLSLGCLLLFKVSDSGSVFAPFAGTTVWLVIPIFGFAACLSASGLMKRIALHIMKIFPTSFKGNITALMATGTILSPLIPSVNAKVSILAPFTSAIADECGYEKGSKGAVGLFSANFISAGILGNAFLTGSVYVSILMGFMSDEVKATFTWGTWFLAAAVWLVLVLVLSYIMIVKTCDPGTASAMSKEYIENRLKEMGKMGAKEKTAAIVLAIAMVCWILQDQIGVSAYITCMIAFGVLAACGLMSGPEFGTKISWATVIMIGGILSLADLTKNLGISAWLAGLIGPYLTWMLTSPYIFVLGICIITYLLRFVVISQVVTVTIVNAIFGALAIEAGYNPFVLLFTSFMAAQNWNLSFHNTLYMSAHGANSGRLEDHKDVVPIAYGYMAINTIACLVSVPVWQLMGFIA